VKGAQSDGSQHARFSEQQKLFADSRLQMCKCISFAAHPFSLFTASACHRFSADEDLSERKASVAMGPLPSHQDYKADAVRAAVPKAKLTPRG